ncbi:MAG TPA: hypothetical protein VK036_07865 [Wenzhouxiangella sp.]|nr:hypothetical protein [Wenzhouxiangella sp.]
MRKIPRKLVLGAALIFFAAGAAASGDILLIQKVEESMLHDLPRNGLSKQQVEQRYGQPNAKRNAVGDPPISRWEYDDFNVYFEHDLVIESVLVAEAVPARQRP